MYKHEPQIKLFLILCIAHTTYSLIDCNATCNNKYHNETIVIDYPKPFFLMLV